MGRLFGSTPKETKEAVPAAPPPDTSAALERFFGDVESTMRAIAECQAMLDNLEPHCQTYVPTLMTMLT